MESYFCVLQTYSNLSPYELENYYQILFTLLLSYLSQQNYIYNFKRIWTYCVPRANFELLSWSALFDFSFSLLARIKFIFIWSHYQNSPTFVLNSSIWRSLASLVSLTLYNNDMCINTLCYLYLYFSFFKM